ncbi:hypothetical protein MAR_019467 [Mya arenaria]|uniref:Uncharacterized protein n=1 Tax=Mya arenaria TaxID=6604 RepID=A0ABY7E271_MYAAR|nr:hypothetical protein MAR_019467 [Mya arenaria]
MQSAEPSSRTGQSCPELVELTSDEVRKRIENGENKNTMKKTHFKTTDFGREKKEIYQIEQDLLDAYVANFILSVRKADGAEYEPTTIRNIVSSLDRKLKRQKYPFNLIAEQTNTFHLTRVALRSETKSLERLGKGNKLLITDEKINMVYEKRILGQSSDASFLNTIGRCRALTIIMCAGISGAESDKHVRGQTKKTGCYVKNVCNARGHRTLSGSCLQAVCSATTN